MTGLGESSDEGIILLFAREPRRGRVKTRLIPVLGEEGALDLYLQLLARQIAVLQASAPCPWELWVAGDLAHPALAAFEGPRRRQEGADLGERMAAAASHALREHPFVILIGGDCPTLDGDYLSRAAAALARGREIVLGPAEDGGYVLIGLRRRRPLLFQGIDWGSAQVLAQTLARARELGEDALLLSALRDIDRPEDLAALAPLGIFPRLSRPLSV